ncbi:hypothetical protein ACN20G_37110 (plasmid) [Streptomyces sp. BI20]|uniref:hypothetical protein n=1 Tax=Streptomyces sp. BI20 TaxID=3403460 RepID=UPI003C7592DB
MTPAYGIAQRLGDRSRQCDAATVHTIPGGVTAFVLLDGVGSSDTVRAWTLAAADRLARACALAGDAETGLRAEYNRHAAESARHDPRTRIRLPHASAVAAVHTPGGRLSVAWCGDARAYLLLDGDTTTRLLTADHNQRRRAGGSPDALTSCLGVPWDDRRTQEVYGHPAIEALAETLPRPGRLLLASDGAYEPYETTGGLTAEHLAGPPTPTAHALVDEAVARARAAGGPLADNSSALIADAGR